jgi:Ca2+-binding RTX toxin-like protein
VINEIADQGTDTVQVDFTYTLAAELENLTLTGALAINGVGNSDANVITGNAAANVLNGLEGADTLNGLLGADTMAGGLDDDTYVVDNAGDVTTEIAGEGIDLVQSSIAHTLAANIEDLTLTGTAAINGNGNDLSNVIKGNTGVNILSGLDGNDTLDGAAGADRLSGGLGDDTFIVDNVGDLVIENAASGTDTVQSSATHTLGVNVENLVLTGSGAINGTGNADANSITGNSGANILNGGAGADILSGGAGNDTYILDNAGDVVNELLNQGTDSVQTSLTYVLGANLENLTLTGTSAVDGTGNSAVNIITGNGANNTLTGFDGNDTLTGLGGSDTTIGGLGNDIHVVDNAGDVTVESAGEGTDTVRSSVTHTLMANLENLTLTGALAIDGTGNDLNNVIIGNSAINVLAGMDGNDTLNGGTGADSMSGGAGNDTYVVENAGDVVTENAGEGADTVQSAITLTLAANVENLLLTGSAAINGTGNAEANSITGNAANNTIDGGDGNDSLSGGAGNDTMTGGAGNDSLSGGTGNDAMTGGSGDDTYTVDAVGDTVAEAANEGTDLVQSSLTFTLGANIENLTLTGSAAIDGTGNALDNVLTGNGGVNKLYGLGGNDTISGGTGADTMVGGAGDDSYTVDNVGDIITELAAEGIDTVQSSVTYTLSSNVENVTLIGTGALNATGNASDNVITGNGAANILTGLDGNDTLNGGLGGDKMTGGLGDDTYVVDSSLDTVIENAGEGTDVVQSRMSYVLGANVENLTLTGTLVINGSGNTLANILTGNGAANVLDGAAGNDTMVGGAGNDTYVVDAAGDVVTEVSGEGTDAVLATVSYALSANVENLTLGGTAGYTATGNDLDNTITGNDGANIILGGAGIDTVDGGLGDDLITGGTGADFLSGGAGNDTFIFTAITDSGVTADTDLVMDFNIGDRFDLSAIDANVSTAGDQAFVIDTNGSFSIGEISIVYDSGSAIVSINQDSDSTAEMVFVVQNVSSLVASDFIL